MYVRIFFYFNFRIPRNEVTYSFLEVNAIRLREFLDEEFFGKTEIIMLPTAFPIHRRSIK